MSAFASVLQSPSIRLLVGDDRKEFTVHRKVLEKHLHNLSIPSRERYIEFDGDEESIGYLLEFMYTRDYILAGAPTATANGTHKPHHHVEEAPAPAPPAEEPIHPIILAARTSGLGVWGRPAALHHKFNHGKPAPKPQHKAPTAVITNGIASPPASPSAHPKENPLANGHTAGSSPFLAHAKVYLLADRYDATSLKEHSLRKLRAALKAFELDPPADRTVTLIKFIKSVYEIPTSSTSGGAYGKETRNKLRDVVVGHAVAYLPELQKDAEFNEYIKGGGDFVGDLFGVLAAGQHKRAH